jgi:hypothetical protein
MRTPLAGRSGLAGPGCRLLIALALAACGASDDGGGGAKAPADDSAGGAATARQASLAAADTCTGPPPAFMQPVLNGPWQGLLDSLAAHGVSFPDAPGNDDTATVKLCRTCTTVAVEIRSSNLTPCLSPGDLSGPGQRILGLLIVQDTFPAQHGWDTLLPGDSVFAFTNSTGGLATLVYDQGGSGKPAPATAWRFWYCQDGHSNPKTARAQWRPRSGTDDPNPGKGNDGDGDEGGGGGTYGWMACASGCCQFYTPPPNQEMDQTTPPQANPHAPDTVGQGNNQGMSQKPSWCKTT